MANEINAINIIGAIDKLEAEAENIEPIDNVLAKAAKAYVKTALDEQYEMTLSSDALMEDIWNGYDLLDAFKAGVKWARENPEYKPELVEYYEEDQTGQPCSLCPFHKIPYAQTCSALFEKHFGKKCATFAVRFEHIANVSKKVDDL